MQVQPISTRLRDVWDDAMDDGEIDDREQATITHLIARADDGTRLALTVLKGGDDTRRAREQRADYERLHAPIAITHTKTRRCHGSDNDAA